MVYLVATLANDAEHLPALIDGLRHEVLVPEPDPKGESWAVGYYADNRALIIKKPSNTLADRSIGQIAGNLKSRILLACVQSTVERERPPPYRHRHWLFGFAGDLSPLRAHASRIRERLPSFIRTDPAHAGVGELAFGMFLAELHRGQMIEDALVDSQELARALKRTADAIKGLVMESGGDVAASFVATNGKVVVVARSGVPLYYKVQQSLEVSAETAPDPGSTDFKRHVEALKRFRAVVVAQTVPEGRANWAEVAEGVALSITSQLEVKLVEHQDPR